MTPEELRERILTWENIHTDFKRESDDRNELAKDLVCFANTDGGQLIFGVSNNREIVGVQDVEGLLRKLEDVAFERCHPPISVIPETVDVDGQVVVVINIPKGDQRPYATRQGQYYVRSVHRCRASQGELLRLFQATEALYYDEQPLPRLALGDMDDGEVEQYLQRVDRVEFLDDLPRLLQAWRLFDGEHPTVAGVVLFGRTPQEHLPFSGVVVAAFDGVDSSEDPHDRKDLPGGLFEVLEAAEQFLSLHLRARHRIRGFESERQVDVPATALREAIVNALVHRDYTVSGPIRIFVLSDRVEVHAPGRAPNTVYAEAMRAGVHVTRNPHIYTRVAEAGLATRAGTGIPRMSRLIREATGRDIGLQATDYEVLLSLPRATATAAPPANGSES